MKDETAINSYELTLTPNYVSDWNFNDALRELIQNGTDQEVLDPDNEFQIDYSQKEKVRRMVEERADDVYHFEFNAYSDDVKKNRDLQAVRSTRILGRDAVVIGKVHLQKLLSSKLAGRE